VDTALNGVCAYFTMFPLAFPLTVLRQHAHPGDTVLDPFCGRGTTNYASRLLGHTSFGIDSSPVASALSQAKLANASADEIVREARAILGGTSEPAAIPQGEFWDWAFYTETLYDLCRLREVLLSDCGSDVRKALRAIVIGALHGPRNQGAPSYFSNQSQRTYAPKPAYAVRFWKSRDLRPQAIDVLEVISLRAKRYYGNEATHARGCILRADSRNPSAVVNATAGRTLNWVITSPPYYGIDTYLADQWLRCWFVGGPPSVDYSSQGQLRHSSPRAYASQLRQVWRNARSACSPDARLVVRFGGINDRKVEPLSLLKASLSDSGWRITEVRAAGSALRGKRQAVHFSGQQHTPLAEYDVWAVSEN